MAAGITTRVNALLRSGLGLSPEAIAAIVGVPSSQLHAFLQNETNVPDDPLSGLGGGPPAGTGNAFALSLPAEYDIPGTLGEPQVQTQMPSDAAELYTVSGGNMAIVSMTAEMLIPDVTLANAQDAQQVGVGFVAFLYLTGHMPAPPANLDPSVVNPSNLMAASAASPAMAPGEWFTVGSVTPPFLAIADMQINLATVANDAAIQWYVPGAKVRNIALSFFEF